MLPAINNAARVHNCEADGEERKKETTPYELFTHRHKKNEARQESTKRSGRGEIKENTCLAPVCTRTGHGRFRGSPRTPLTIFFNLSLWTVSLLSLLSLTFHFMSALAGTLTSSSSFFIMFVSGCAVLSGKALVSRKKSSQHQREGEGDRTRCHPDRPE